MLIKFEPSGTHVHKGFLKVRTDLYPVLGESSYNQFYVLDSETSQMKITPCLSIFIVVPEALNIADLSDKVKQLLTKDILATVNKVVSYPNSAHYISALFKNQLKFTSQKIITIDNIDLVNSVNQKLSALVPFNLSSTGIFLPVEPKSIDVGADATDRASNISIKEWCIFGAENPANATGTIDTVQTWLDAQGDTCAFGMAHANGANWDSTDFEDVGVIAGGSQQTKTGLTISVLVGDYIGIDNGNDTSSLSRDVSGSGVYDASVAFPFTNRAFNLTASRTISLYGTGVEAGGGVAIPIMMHHYKMMRS